MIWFVLGIYAGVIVSAIVFLWLIISPKAPFITVDPWWLLSEDNWEWLRTQLIKERGDK